MRYKIIIWTLVLLFLGSPVMADLNTDLWIYYNFSTGTTDMLGHNDLTNNGATQVTGILNNAYNFDGNNDYMAGTTAYKYAENQNWTVCFWYNGTESRSAPQDGYGFISRGDTSAYGVIGPEAGKPVYSRYDGAWLRTPASTTPINDGNGWTHLCYVNYNSKTMSIYINSSLDVTDASDIQAGQSFQPYQLMVVDLGGTPKYTNGSIDELGVWNYSLPLTDIQTLYNGGAGCGPPFNCAGGGGAQTDIIFTAIDDWNASAINYFSVNITWANGSQNTYSTTTGVINVSGVGNPGSLNVTFWNTTNYFNTNLLNQVITVNISNTIQAEIFQAVACFDAEAYVSNASVTPDNFTIGTTTRTSCFNLTAGSHNVMAQLSGWYNKNQTFTISALSNTTHTVENMTYANLTIYAIDGTTNESLGNYDISINSVNYTGWPGEAVSGVTNYSFYLINETYNISINVPGYAITTAKVNVTVSGHTNYTFTLYKSNSVRIYIWDEITGNPILDNITIRWSSNSTTWENVTDTGQLFVYNLTADQYELLFYASNYSTRSYTITVGPSSTQILNAYMINSEYSTIFTIKDIDTGDTIDGVAITMFKLINSTWTTVESKFSDISGKAQFYYDPIAHYKFFLAEAEYEDYVFFLNPILFSSYDVFMTKTTVLNYSVDFDEISIIYAPKVFYNNENTSFNYLISSPDGTLVDYSIKLTYPGGSSSASGVNAIGEQLSAWVNITGATSFESVILEYNYTTTLSGQRSYKAYLPIIVNETGGTWLQNKDETYGLGLFERLLIVTVIILFAVGIATMVGQVVPGLVIGLFLFGFMVYIGFVPLWAILPSMLVGVLFVVWKSGGV